MIKDGFFELRPKFKQEGPSSIYINHNVLHDKHPILKKLHVNTLKTLLGDSAVISLSANQTLYKSGSSDPNIYIILFGKLVLWRSPKYQSPSEFQVKGDAQSQSSTADQALGKVNVGWTLGEEILFDRSLQLRAEKCVASTEACLLGIDKHKLAVLQANLL